jgi:poly [ADP-ribose] polymerase
MSTVKEHKKCICVEFGKTNNNKFWEYTIYKDGTAMTAFGRVDVTRKENVSTPTKALAKWRAKTRASNKPDKRYTEVKVAEGVTLTSSSVVASSNLKAIIKKDIVIKDPLVKNLFDFLEKENVHDIAQASGGSIQYDVSAGTFKTPLGVIMPDQVSEARDLLDAMADYVVNQKFGSVVLARKLNEYLRLIPHAVGMKKITPELILPNVTALQTENNLLDGLTASFNDIQDAATSSTGKKKVVQPKLFDVTLDVVRDRVLISRIKKYFNDTKLNMHVTAGYSVKKVYEVKIGAMNTAYESTGSKVGNVMELWHGTKCSNLLSILKIGLIIPRSSSGHVTGRMFGDGLYFSDQSTKALNYATNFWRGGGSTRRVFMFLADVAMGKPYTPSGWGRNFPRSGFDSTFAKGGRSGVSNNEMIVYETNKANLKYLIEFE